MATWLNFCISRVILIYHCFIWGGNMLAFLLKFVSFYAVIEFIMINALAEFIKYVSLKFIVKLDDQVKDKLAEAEQNMKTTIDAVDEANG